MDNRSNPVWAGLSVLGGFIVGIIALLGGLLAILNEFNYIGVGFWLPRQHLDYWRIQFFGSD